VQYIVEGGKAIAGYVDGVATLLGISKNGRGLSSMVMGRGQHATLLKLSLKPVGRDSHLLKNEPAQ